MILFYQDGTTAPMMATGHADREATETPERRTTGTYLPRTQLRLHYWKAETGNVEMIGNGHAKGICKRRNRENRYEKKRKK